VPLTVNVEINACPVACHLVPPSSRMGPLTEAEIAPRLQTPQAKKYAVAIDRESAREVLEKRHAEQEAAEAKDADVAAPAKGDAKSARDEEESSLGKFLRSPVARSIAVTVAGTLTRTLLGALTGKRRR
jgi:uncharacterized protein